MEARVLLATGPILNPDNGHYYDFIPTAGLNWTQSKEDAANRSYNGGQGHLVTITSPAENTFVFENIVKLQANFFNYIGLYQPPGSPEPAGNWQWITGEPLSFNAWYPGREPNNVGNQNTAFMAPGETGFWTDVEDTQDANGYVIEYEPPAEAAAPSGLRISSTRSALSITWTDRSANESSFLIQRATNPDFGTPTNIYVLPNTTAYTDTDLGPTGTQYYYRVAAVNESGRSSFSNIVNAVWGNVMLPKATFFFPFDEGVGTTTRDVTNNGITGTLQTGVTWLRPGKVGRRAVDNANSIIFMNKDGAAYDIGAAVLGGTGSVAAWVKTTQVGTEYPWQSPGLTGVTVVFNQETYWGWIDNTGRIGLSAGRGPSAKSAQPINDGQWHHVALTRNADTGEVKVYVDGALSGSGISDTGFKTRGFGQIGGIGGSPMGLRAQLDEFGVYPFVLSESEIAMLATPSGPPAAPSDLDLMATGTGFKLNWTDNSGDEAGFLVQRSTDADFVAPVSVFVAANVTSYSDGDVDSAATYYYRVATVNDEANSDFSSVVSGKAGTRSTGAAGHYYNNNTWAGEPDVHRLDPSINLTSVAGNWQPASISSDYFSVIWTGKVRADVTGLHTFVTATDDAGVLYVNGQQVSEDLSPPGFRDAVNLTPINLTAGQEYNFIMKMREGTGNAIAQLKWSTPDNATRRIIPSANLSPFSDVPPTPAGFSTSAVSSTQATLTWTDNAINELSWTLERSIDAAFTSPKVVATFGENYTPTMSFTDTGLVRGGRYYYRLRASNFDGSSAYATLDFIAEPPVEPPAPMLFVGSDSGADMIRLKLVGGNVVIHTTPDGSGMPVVIRPMASITTLTVKGLGGDDTLILDFSNGAPIPLGGLTFTGGAGDDDVFFTTSTNYDSFTGSSASLDLADNELVVNKGNLTEVESWLASSRLFSSSKAGRTTLAPFLQADNSIVVRLAYSGDMNGDGTVNALDYFSIDSNFLSQTPGTPVHYSQGDINFDGTINALDYFLIDSAFLGQSSPLSTGLAASPARRVAKPRPRLFSLTPLRKTKLRCRKRPTIRN